MATPTKKAVLVRIDGNEAKAPPALAKKLSSPLKPMTSAALKERMEAAAVRRDIELESKQFKAKESAKPKGTPVRGAPRPPSPIASKSGIRTRP